MRVTRPVRRPSALAAAALVACCTSTAAPQAPATKIAPAPATAPAAALANRQYLTFAMTRQGDAARGKSLFFDQQRLACGRCHTVEGGVAGPGPGLSAIGDKFGRRDLVDSILALSATTASGYSTNVVTTRARARPISAS